jgi:hypothetical protein
MTTTTTTTSTANHRPVEISGVDCLTWRGWQPGDLGLVGSLSYDDRPGCWYSLLSPGDFDGFEWRSVGGVCRRVIGIAELISIDSWGLVTVRVRRRWRVTDLDEAERRRIRQCAHEGDLGRLIS